MKNTNFSRFAKLWVAALVLVCGVAFTGCKPEVQYRDIALEGTWVESGECGNSYYEISFNSFKNYGDTYESYEGNNLVIRETSSDSGYIYIKYTKSMNPDYSYSTNAPDVGKWYAISYKNLTINSISIAGAYSDAAGAKTSTDTLEEAIKEFTIEKNYFGTYSECTKK